MNRKRRKKHHDSGYHYESGPYRHYVVNILLFLSLTLILTSSAILIYSFFEDKTKRPMPMAAAKPEKPESRADALIKKMGDIVTAEPYPEVKPSESDDYEHALELIKPAEKKPEPAAPKKLPPTLPEKPVVAEKPAPAEEPVIAEKPPLKPVAVPTRKPKLAIIIDDVSSHSQVKNLRSVGIPLSLSIFPPTSDFPSTPKIARGLDFYMIHLPLEALRFNRPQEKTLTVTSSPIEIEGRIKEIRRLFPGAALINNHTGSKFTADDRSMKLLLHTLKKYDFTFIDSRTTAKSKAKEAGKWVGMPVLSRDIFLDNIADVGYIHKQLKKAVALAKKRGQAIAIGHPRSTTLEALRKSAAILKDVEVVYVKELI